MDNISEILQTIYIGAVVATFLFNTGSIIKAVDIFNECLVLLNGKALETIKELTTPLLIGMIFKYFLLVPMPFEGLIVELLDLIWYVEIWR